jgi:hypothetical protein
MGLFWASFAVGFFSYLLMRAGTLIAQAQWEAQYRS